MTRKFLFTSAVLTLVLLVPALCLGGSFRTYPTKLVVKPEEKAQTLKIVNEGEEKVTIQITAFEWKQDENGKDELVPTKDLVFYPRTFEFEGGQEQTIKAGYEMKRGGTERTFRLIVEEIPMEAVGRDASQLRMVLRMSIPVFVKPEGGDAKPDLDIADVHIEENKLFIRVRNSGREHVFVKTLAAEGSDGVGKNVLSGTRNGWYVLADSSSVFDLGAPEGVCSSLKNLDLKVVTEGETLEKKFGIDAIQCVD